MTIFSEQASLDCLANNWDGNEQVGKLLISRFDDSDRDALAEMLDDREVRAALYGDILPTPSFDFALKDWCRDPWRNGIQLVLRHAATGGSVGCIRLEKRELSFFIARPYWGQGHGGATVRWFVETLDSRADHLLFASVRRDNIQSRRILEGARFRFLKLQFQSRGGAPMLNYARSG